MLLKIWKQHAVYKVYNWEKETTRFPLFNCLFETVEGIYIFDFHNNKFQNCRSEKWNCFFTVIYRISYRYLKVFWLLKLYIKSHSWLKENFHLFIYTFWWLGCIDLLYVLAQSYPFQEVVEPLSFLVCLRHFSYNLFKSLFYALLWHIYISGKWLIWELKIVFMVIFIFD